MGIFREAGATNVSWIWAPNVAYQGSTGYRSLYPGSRYVDQVGVSGYYVAGGSTNFEQIFGPSLAQLRKITGKRVMLTEVAASDAAGTQAELVSDLFAGIGSHPEISGVVWFEVDMEEDLRIAPRPESASAFARAVADARYLVGSMAPVPQNPGAPLPGTGALVVPPPRTVGGPALPVEPPADQ